MARPVSNKVNQILEDLRKGLSTGYHAQGSQFLSNRAIARQYGVSYQTAHRILTKLSSEGLILRKAGAGSNVAGARSELTEVAIVFQPRAFVEGTFGWQLRTRLETELMRLKLPFCHFSPDRLQELQFHQYPVFWNVEPIPVSFLHQKRFCLILNHRPSVGLYAHWLDSVSIDDYGGGLMAAQLMYEMFGCREVCVVSGPKSDIRSIARMDGFCSIYPKARILNAGSWGRPMPKRLFKEIIECEHDGVFCVNDRIASRILREVKWPKNVPRIVGFDDTPVALENELTTIAIPWDALIESACSVIQQRLKQDSSAARDSILRPQAVIREKGRSH